MFFQYCRVSSRNVTQALSAPHVLLHYTACWLRTNHVKSLLYGSTLRHMVNVKPDNETQYALDFP